MSNLSLYSSYGTQAIQSLYNQSYTSTYTNTSTGTTTTTTSSMANVLSGIDGGFNTSSIFSTNTGLQSNNSSCSTSSRGYIDDTVLSHRSSLPQTDNPYANGGFGASIISNYLNSISTVATGGDAPMSVLEQRLNYHLPLDQQINQAGTMYGDTSNYFNVDSVKQNLSSTSPYNSSKTSKKKLSEGLSGSTSNLMSLLA